MAPPVPAPQDLGLSEEGVAVDTLTREVLGDNYLHFHLAELQLHEVAGDDEAAQVRVELELQKSISGDVVQVKGQGVGLIDAVFDGFIAAFADEFPSLKTVRVADFSMQSDFEDHEGGRPTDAQHKRRTDALAHAELSMSNSEGIVFRFRHKTKSLTRSALRVAIDALTFFVNSERAYVQLHLAVEDARSRRRSDLVQKYSQQMGTLVGATSYSEVIEKLRGA